jgi:hypothetical protein
VSFTPAASRSSSSSLWRAYTRAAEKAGWQVRAFFTAIE